MDFIVEVFQKYLLHYCFFFLYLENDVDESAFIGQTTIDASNEEEKDDNYEDRERTTDYTTENYKIEVKMEYFEDGEGEEQLREIWWCETLSTPCY